MTPLALMSIASVAGGLAPNAPLCGSAGRDALSASCASRLHRDGAEKTERGEPSTRLMNASQGAGLRQGRDSAQDGLAKDVRNPD